MGGFDLNLGDIYALLTAGSWGVAVIFFKLAGQHFRAIPLKMLHNALVTTLFGVSAYFVSGLYLPDFTAWEYSRLLLSAVVGITIADTTHIAAIRRLGASGAAIIDTLYLPIILIMAFYFYSETLGLKEIIGGAVVIAGVTLASFDPNHHVLSKRDLLIGCLFGVITQVGHAATVMLVKDLLAKESVLLLSFIRFGLGSLILLAIAARREPLRELFAAFTFDKRLLVSLPGAILGLYLSTFLWFLGFKYTLAGRAAIYNQLATVFVILLAALFLRERITIRKAIAVALAISGSLVVAMN